MWCHTIKGSVLCISFYSCLPWHLGVLLTLAALPTVSYFLETANSLSKDTPSKYKPTNLKCIPKPAPIPARTLRPLSICHNHPMVKYQTTQDNPYIPGNLKPDYSTLPIPSEENAIKILVHFLVCSFCLFADHGVSLFGSSPWHGMVAVLWNYKEGHLQWL